MEKKHIFILATGGTIAGVGDAGKNTGYISGQIVGQDLVSAIPEIADIANVTVEQICNVNSDDMTAALWLKLSKRIDTLADFADSFVITHGTDTMDETAYFLSSTLKTRKPVILTGSMRPATAKEPDGPINLLGAVKFAVQCKNFPNSVWVYFGGKAYDAQNVQKCSASALQPMGIDFPGDEANRSAGFPKFHFDISKMAELPKVNIVYFAVDADSRILSFAASISDGLVIAGAGSGEFSLAWSETLAQIKIPIVISSRIHHGVVTLNKKLSKAPVGAFRMSAGALPPQKAAVLLRLALTVSHDAKTLGNFFKSSRN